MSLRKWIFLNGLASYNQKNQFFSHGFHRFFWKLRPSLS
ncbi:hypothetical protein BSBH6_03604 [Bacillus subtilis]|nr:hypothetical protein BSBH6_03604 [Bacillus subtilis]RPK22343.1 hypothetical protein BH5_03608 [Bacillus subtilis]